MPGDDDALRDLRDVASQWQTEGNDLGAGMAMEKAARAAWGNLDQLSSCVSAALESFERCMRSGDCSAKGFIAIKKAAQLHWMPSNASRRSFDELQQALADRLEWCSESSEHVESYLVRGLVIETDFERTFNILYPDYDVDGSTETAGGGKAQVTIPGAFQLFVTMGDYHSAHRIATSFPAAFTSDSLQGWKAAVRGLTGTGEPALDFEAAAEAFALDRLPQPGELRYGRSWSSINVELWSPYFRSRSAMATAIDDPRQVRQYVEVAADTAPQMQSGWHHPTVARYVILVNALARLLRDGSPLVLQKAQDAMTAEQRLTGEQPEDQLITRFLAIAAESFEGFQADPEREITSGRLRDALLILGRIPIIEPGFANALAPALGNQAISALQGPVRTRMYRALEAIRDERQLQQIVLRLSQASLPAYAQLSSRPI